MTNFEVLEEQTPALPSSGEAGSSARSPGPRGALPWQTPRLWCRTVLDEVRHGDISVQQVLALACEDENRALRQITLVRLLAAQPGWSVRRACGLRDQVAARLGVAPGDWNVAWLLDPRAGGRRQLVWADVLGDAPALGERFPFHLG